MATTQKKSTSKAKSGGSRAASGAKKSGSRASSASRSRAAAKQQQPIRREVGGVVLLLAALCVLVSYFTSEGWLIELFPRLLKGCFGVGFYLIVPALIAGSWVLLNHKGQPVGLRTAAALLIPYLCGGVWHMLFCKVDLGDAAELFPKLWETGYTLESGGVLSGATAHGFMTILGRPASVLVFVVLIAILLMAVARVTPEMLLEMWRNRPYYDEEDYYEDDDYEEPPPPPRIKKKEPAPRKAQGGKRGRAPIDIPLDGETSRRPDPWTPDKAGAPSQFFQPREKDQLTPADLLQQKHAELEHVEAELAPVETAPPPVWTPEPVPEPEPVEPEIFEPEIVPEPEPPAPVEAQPPQPPVVSEPKRKKKGITSDDVEEASAQVAAEIESVMAAGEGEYAYPPVSLLDLNGQENYVEAGAELRTNAQRLAGALQSFGVSAFAGDVVRGPAVTRYEFTLDQGVKLSKVTNLADDIALALGASGVRIAPIPGKISVVGIEVPNKAVSPVLIRDVLESRTFSEHKSSVAFALGRDIGNQDIVGDIARLPHVLIAGTTGSGKSVCTNSLIISLLYKSSPEDVRFIMVDPKMVELAPYNGIPHLLIPVVTDSKKAAGALQWAVFEMESRYKTFSELGVKKLEEYNALAARREDLSHMASVVVVIDELADLMMVAAKEVEDSIVRVAQKGRASGVHLVIATQSPRADVITGLMKANIPSRIAFAVASGLESRIILDDMGAEKLVGRGDMLYAPIGGGKPTRVQGCYITPEEIDRVVHFVKSNGETQYSDEVMRKIEESVQEKDKKGGGSSTHADVPSPADECDELLPAAVDVILDTNQASVSMLQRRLKLGYSRAARLVDQMEERGYVGPFEGSKPRQILITKAKWQEIKMGSPSAGESTEEVPEMDDPWAGED